MLWYWYNNNYKITNGTVPATKDGFFESFAVQFNLLRLILSVVTNLYKNNNNNECGRGTSLIDFLIWTNV